MKRRRGAALRGREAWPGGPLTLLASCQRGTLPHDVEVVAGDGARLIIRLSASIALSSHASAGGH